VSTRISATLSVADGSICCASCGHQLAPAGTSWKQHAALLTTLVKSLPGAGSAIEERVVLRQFCCPSCADLLDTETAMPDDSFLEDVVNT
jgi:acetone carboxylase gamma subunit